MPKTMQSAISIYALCGAALLAACLSYAAPAMAHGPTPQKVQESVVISAPAKDVWAAIKEFANIGDWHPGIKSVNAKGGNEGGAERTVTLPTGVIVESLDSYDEKDLSYSYRLLKENHEAIPVSFYSATITVKAVEKGSEVTWLGRFYRADTSNFPPEHLNDQAAKAAMKDFFRQGLDGLKAKLGSS